MIVRKHVQRRRAEVTRGFVERSIDRCERRRRDPHREHQPVRRVHQHDAENGAVQADLVEHARDVDVDRQVRDRLRQQEEQQDRAAPGQPQPRERVAGGNRDREADDDGEHGDPDAGPERGQRVAARIEHALPEQKAEFRGQLAREVPLLRERPEHQVEQRTEDREREERQQRSRQQHPRPAARPRARCDAALIGAPWRYAPSLGRASRLGRRRSRAPRALFTACRK